MRQIGESFCDVTGDPLSATALAKEWRKHPERRRTIVQQIDRMDRWQEFRFDDLYRDGQQVLIARITDADRERINGASCHMKRRDREEWEMSAPLIRAACRDIDDALHAELLGDAPVSEERLSHWEAQYPDYPAEAAE